MRIDHSVLTSAMTWLLKLQGPRGEFSEVGQLIHTEMRGGLDNGPVALTAYVLLALLEDETYAVRSAEKGEVRVKCTREGRRSVGVVIFSLVSSCRQCTRAMCPWPRATWRTKCPARWSVTTACV